MSQSQSRRVQTRRTTETGDPVADDKWQVLADTGPILVPSSNNPTAKIVAPDTAAANSVVTLDGSQSTGNQLTHKWFQPHGTTAVLMPSATAPIVTFVAVDNTSGGQSIDHTLMFTLHVKDSAGHDSVTSVDIKVLANPDPSKTSPPQSPQQPPPPVTQSPQAPPSEDPNQSQDPTVKPNANKFTADVINHSTKISTEQLQVVCAAVKKQMDNEVARYWGHTASFNFGPPVPGNVKLGIFDQSDQPGAAGWHSANKGEVTIECFYVSTYENLCVTISHEMLETIGDYDAETTIKGKDEDGKECLYWLENCDPVEENWYWLDNIQVSNFVTPAWFALESSSAGVTPTDARTDFMQVTKQAFDIAPNGYMQVSYDNGQTWVEVRDRKHFDEWSGTRKQKREQRQFDRSEAKKKER